MDYSNFIILLARQRSGTNALRSVLTTHPDIFCLSEVFRLDDQDSDDVLVRDINYFNFLRKYTRDDIDRLLPYNHEQLFLDFLEYLRCFASKYFIIIDVKYNQVHHITQSHRSAVDPPYLLKLIIAHGLRTLVLTRKNYLRYFISLMKAKSSGQYMIDSSNLQNIDSKVQINRHELLYILNRCHEEDQLVRECFTSYPRYLSYNYDNKYFSCDYDELFPTATTGVSNEFLNRFSTWLGIRGDFNRKTSYKKQSYLPLDETIENYDEIARALRGTRFEYCLTDERIYRTS